MSSSEVYRTTIRFRDPKLHEELRLQAELLGISMNRLAEDAIRRELLLRGAELEDKLTATLEKLRSFKEEDFSADAKAFAEAEVEHDDPLRARMVESDE